ncbi:benzoate 4-monooxygenase cytochrome P450 [Mariannaea sp. PMI_226]|nr:benzoate 4-monooxygenase cytochrome P450 [Mariannaea sp. PMI_226]
MLVLLSLYVVYVLYLHPLAKFPGPLRSAVSPDWMMKRWSNGHFVFTIKELHDKYGPVVRIAANQLSFSSATSWKDIYGHTPGRKAFLKGTFYEPMPGEVRNLLSESDPAIHSSMRRNLSHGFSATALKSQEDLIQKFIDLFISRINGKQSLDEKLKTVDAVKWFNFLTFDIIGELAFGDTFGSLREGTPHFWIETVFSGVKAITFIRSFEYFPLLRSLFRNFYKYQILPSRLSEPRRKMVQYATNKIQKRLNTEPERIDFLTKMIANREKDGTSFRQLQSQADMMVVAGSETTATALSGITYYLCHNKNVYDKVAEEVRSSFSRYEDITAQATESLPYLKAVIEEGLRLYPPVPIGLPRVSPGEIVDGYFIPKGTIVSVSSWASTHSEQNFHHPFEFIPERWLGKDKESGNLLSASQPFSIGSRGCLGRNLAYMEMRIILSKMFWTYDFEAVDKSLDWVASNRSFVFWEKPELHVIFHPRSQDIENATNSSQSFH